MLLNVASPLIAREVHDKEEGPSQLWNLVSGILLWGRFTYCLLIHLVGIKKRPSYSSRPLNINAVIVLLPLSSTTFSSTLLSLWFFAAWNCFPEHLQEASFTCYLPSYPFSTFTFSTTPLALQLSPLPYWNQVHITETHRAYAPAAFLYLVAIIHPKAETSMCALCKVSGPSDGAICSFMVSHLKSRIEIA